VVARGRRGKDDRKQNNRLDVSLEHYRSIYKWDIQYVSLEYPLLGFS
jgi:hypothetical protein